MKQYKLGQIVQLRSGGPHMTVEIANWKPQGQKKKAPKEVQCVWFADASGNELRRNQFPVKSLKRIKPIR